MNNSEAADLIGKSLCGNAPYVTDDEGNDWMLTELTSQYDRNRDDVPPNGIIISLETVDEIITPEIFKFQVVGEQEIWPLRRGNDFRLEALNNRFEAFKSATAPRITSLEANEELARNDDGKRVDQITDLYKRISELNEKVAGLNVSYSNLCKHHGKLKDRVDTIFQSFSNILKRRY